MGRESANTVFILVRQSLLPTSSPQETRLGVPLSHKSFTPSETHKDNPSLVFRCFTTRDS
ncbi:hypothetical protein HKD37_05G013011 [Glycine soja]